MYYTPVTSDEHYPYGHEVVEFLINLGYKDPQDEPIKALVKKQLNAIENKYSEPKLYYKHKYGLSRVYPHAREAIKSLIPILAR